MCHVAKHLEDLASDVLPIGSILLLGDNDSARPSVKTYMGNESGGKVISTVVVSLLSVVLMVFSARSDRGKGAR